MLIGSQVQSTKVSQKEEKEGNEYRQLQDKLDFLENKIQRIKSNIQKSTSKNNPINVKASSNSNN